MSVIATQVALNELVKALEVLSLPHDKLPKVIDPNGAEVIDPKDKRLALVAEYVHNAGDVINLLDQAQTSVEMALRMNFPQSFAETVNHLTGGRGLPGMLPQSKAPAPEQERQMGFHQIMKDAAAIK